MDTGASDSRLKKLPVGIQSFGEIITEGYLYADKTKYIYDMQDNGKYYFLSRPRRFGKSLLVDTMKELFEGNRELFKGLWIDSSGYDFEKYPVIRLDMTQCDVSSVETLKSGLMQQFEQTAHKYGVSSIYNVPAQAFVQLIDDLKAKYNKRVVVLIDEYDKPVIDFINNQEQANANREAIGSVYGVLKGQDANLKFVFLTGVSKFTRMSIFSKLNNLSDITLDKHYAGICGITEREFDENFIPYVEAYHAEQKLGNTPDGDKDISDIRDDIFTWYDGYTWDGATRVFNPFSLLRFFSRNEYSDYWYSSGTPKFLYDVFKNRPNEFADIQATEIMESDLDSHEIEEASVVSLLFQTGFLSVKTKIIDHPVRYLLGYPNIEVSQAMAKQFIESVTTGAEVRAFISDIRTALDTGDIQAVEDCLTGLYASIPYQLHMPYEAYYQTLFLGVMQFLGFKVSTEVSVAKGRIDGTLDRPNGNSYVIEFKYRKTVEGKEYSDDEISASLDDGIAEAFSQIDDRGYADKYAGTRRKVRKLAVCVAGRGNVRVKSL